MSEKKERQRRLDRLVRSRQFLVSTVSLRLRHKITASIRTAYTVFLVLLLMQFWEWSDVAFYLAPVIAIIASAPYFGLWQENFVKVLRSVPICAGMGVIVGLTSEMKPLQLALIFVGIVWINLVPNWDRLCSLLGSLSFIIGAVYPNTSSDSIDGTMMFATILALNIFPFLIGGFSLLFPNPALAIFSARFQALFICRKLAHMIIAVVKAFLSQDDLDTCIAEFDQYNSELVSDVAALKVLAGHVDYERLVFRSVDRMPEALNILFMVVDRVQQELVGARDMLVRISFNKTQHHFADQLLPALIEMAEQMEIALTLIGEHLETFDPFRGILPAFLRTAWNKLFRCDCLQDQTHCFRQQMGKMINIPSSHKLIEEHLHAQPLTHGLSNQPTALPDHATPQGNDGAEGMQHYSFTIADIEQGGVEEKAGDIGGEAEIEAEEHASARSSCGHFHRSAASHNRGSEAGESVDSPSGRELFQQAIQCLSRARSALLLDYSEARKDIISFRTVEALEIEEIEEAPVTVVPSFRQAENGLEARGEASDEGEEKEEAQDGRRETQPGTPPFSLSTPFALDPHPAPPSHGALARRHEHIQSMRQETMRLSWRNFGPRGAYMHRLSITVEFIATLEQVFTVEATPFHLLSYLVSCGLAIVAYFLAVGQAWLQAAAYCRESFAQHPSHPCTALREITSTFLKAYGQAIKVAATVVLTSSILLYDLMPFLYQGGLWMTMVVVIVRQDLTSSAVLTSIQRLEGTVVGAMYAFFAYTLFSCDTQRCGYWFEIPTLVLWVFVCGLFRDGPQHGYAATVASLTPIILIMAPVNDMMGAWGRIEETFLGIVFYVVIDNLFLPKRIYPQTKASVLACIDDARLVYHECMAGLQTVTHLEQFYSAQRTEHTWQWEASDVEEDGVGVYGPATRVRYRSNTQLSFVDGGVLADLADPPPPPSSGRSLSYSDAESPSAYPSTFAPTYPSSPPSSSAGAASGEPPSLTDHSAPQAVQDLLSACSQHFHAAETQLIAMKARLDRQGMLVGLVQYEPELWRRTFPQAVYVRLLEAFKRVFVSGLALNSGARAFTVILCQMMRRNENISQHLETFRYMIKHLFLISAKADDAMLKAYDSFKKMYARTGEDVDISSLLTLRRVCEKLMDSVEEHFRDAYAYRRPEELLTLSPYFLVAWQNVFESCQDLVKDLSGLGTTLLTVRNTESLAAL